MDLLSYWGQTQKLAWSPPSLALLWLPSASDNRPQRPFCSRETDHYPPPGGVNYRCLPMKTPMPNLITHTRGPPNGTGECFRFLDSPLPGNRAHKTYWRCWMFNQYLNCSARSESGQIMTEVGKSPLASSPSSGEQGGGQNPGGGGGSVYIAIDTRVPHVFLGGVCSFSPGECVPGQFLDPAWVSLCFQWGFAFFFCCTITTTNDGRVNVWSQPHQIYSPPALYLGQNFKGLRECFIFGRGAFIMGAKSFPFVRWFRNLSRGFKIVSSALRRCNIKIPRISRGALYSGGVIFFWGGMLQNISFHCQFFYFRSWCLFFPLLSIKVAFFAHSSGRSISHIR